MITSVNTKTFSDDPISGIAENMRMVAHNLSQRLLTLSADPDASLDEIGKLQRAITGILNSLKRQPEAEAKPHPHPAPPEEPEFDSVPDEPQTQEKQEPQTHPAEPEDRLEPDSPSAEPVGLTNSNGPPATPETTPAPPPKPKRNQVQVPPKAHSRYGPPRSSKPPKYMRRMMKRAARNRGKRKR